jgi:hypothetical protein
MISTAYGFIFIHVPKTGGNSIQEALLPLSDDRKIFGGKRDGVNRFEVAGPVTPFKHATLADYEARLTDLSRYKIVVSVRHPLDRAISAYFSPHRWMRRESDDSWTALRPRWDRCDFLTLIDELEPMVAFLQTSKGQIVPDYTLRFEHLQQDYEQFVQAMALPAQAQLAMLNTSAAAPMKRMVACDAFVRKAVLERFREDFSVFGYACHEEVR